MKSRKIDKVNTVIAAWETVASKSTFAGMTLEEFKAKVQPLLDQTDNLSALRIQIKEARKQQELEADEANAQALLVVNAVKGDPTFGEDSPLYAALGYICKSNRKSGLKRVLPTATQPVAPTAPAA